MQNWKEVPVDSMILSLQYLQSFYSVEISRGFSKEIGNYNLHDQFKGIESIPPAEINVIVPDKIVATIRENNVSASLSSLKELNNIPQQPIDSHSQQSVIPVTEREGKKSD